MSEETKHKTEETVRTFAEELSVAGNQLIGRVQELISEGNIRRLVIKDSNGRLIVEVPLTLGVVGGAGVAIFAPFLAALGALAGLLSRVQIVVERYEDPADAAKEATSNVVDLND
ncbi:MAG TPA: DUF4342 domain-containing protein [Aggregatilineales bacterium]|nr:DUF4342 domain-containing protein [Anaerolineales bacterium]HRE49617.1 DUF4342 domain-containing protein [Aggregatilineales bacterium]